MTSPIKRENGWEAIPLSLKILFVVLLLWALGSVFALPTRIEAGLPFFGIWINGISAGIVVLILDLLAPLVFLLGLWKRRKWAVSLGISYNATFVVNSLVALFFFRDTLGTAAILIPALASSIFLAVIYTKKSYFR